MESGTVSTPMMGAINFETALGISSTKVVAMAEDIPDSPIMPIRTPAAKDHAFDIAISYDSPSFVGEMPKHIEIVPLFQEDYCILCPIDTPLPDRVLTPADLDMSFEVVHQGYGNQRIQKWRESHGLSNAKPYFVASSMMSIHTYLLDRRCWCFALSNVAFQTVADHPDALTIRRIAPAPECRTCNALILTTYPEARIIRSFMECMDEYVAKNPYLRKRTNPVE